MTTTNEPAGVWVRVSSGGQDEINQVPDVERHCTQREYRVARRYELNDKSASKGEQQDKLNEMLSDMRDGTIRVLVCWHSDRLERRGPEYLFGLLRQVRDAGGRIESVKEPLSGTADLSGEALTALGAVMSHQYSVHLSEQVKASHDRSRANGALVTGGIPWGYVVTGEKYNKTIIPTEECREFVTQIFERCIDGDSCYTIARWLNDEGVKPTRGDRWSDTSVWQLIHNMTYAGRRQDEGEHKENKKGKLVPTRKHRRTILECEPVIDMDMWQRANDALARRPGRGPGVNGVLRPEPLLVSLRCARCEDSPMYRIRTYYRCTGRRPQRTGCGNMVPLDQLDMIITVRVFMISTEPYKTRQWVKGQNWDAEIAGTKQTIREVTEAERWDELPALTVKLADLRRKNETEAAAGHYEQTVVRNPDDTVMTEGQHFRELDTDGQREYLKTRDIRAEKVTIPDDHPVRSKVGQPGIRVVIDGRDYGITPIITRKDMQMAMASRESER